MTGKRRAKPASPIPETLVADICADVYRQSLGEYDAASMVQKDEEKQPGCGDTLLRKRAMIYQKTVRRALLGLYRRRLLILPDSSEAPQEADDDCPPLDDEIPELEEP